MISIENLLQVANQIETERGISKEILYSAIEQALVSACRKKFPEEAILEAKVDPLASKASLFQVKKAVKEVVNTHLEIKLSEAKKQEPKIKEGDDLYIPVEMTDFGRIAAQIAKQVIMQRIREAEKDSIYKDLEPKEGKIVTGTVQRIENRNFLIDLGRVEAILHYKEQIPTDQFAIKDKVKLFVSKIEKTQRGIVVHVSRTHPGLLRSLFELEIPEIQDGIITVMSVSREPGKRAKVAVKSNNPAIGAVGTCVGQMGGRIQNVIKELGDKEKIDVLEWDENPKKFIANALKPAKISQVIITNEKEKTALVVVPNDQLSLAIGTQGINVRLSVKLTNWKIDIVSQEEYEKNNESETKLSIVEKIKLDLEKNKQDEKGQEIEE